MSSPSKPRCTTITPIVPVSDLDRALDFYTRVLGFSVQAQVEGYAYIVRDDVAIRLIKALDERPAEQACYICVENLDGLFHELEPGLSGLPQGRVRPPFDQPYGQREFHVIDEDSVLIFFGEPATT